ncbi:hypothetical protein DSUL_30022 [Desulfovibrionales bacterium]
MLKTISCRMMALDISIVPMTAPNLNILERTIILDTRSINIPPPQSHYFLPTKTTSGT